LEEEVGGQAIIIKNTSPSTRRGDFRNTMDGQRRLELVVDSSEYSVVVLREHESASVLAAPS